MRPQDIVIGEYYRHKDHPNYAYAKPIAQLKPHSGLNTHGYTIFKCEWSTEKDPAFGLIKYFRATDLIREVSQPS